MIHERCVSTEEPLEGIVWLYKQNKKNINYDSANRWSRSIVQLIITVKYSNIDRDGDDRSRSASPENEHNIHRHHSNGVC